jgi:hypothetical protein
LIESPEPTTPESLVHPLLTPPLSIIARWRGDIALHAGGFFANNRAWGLLGQKKAGKSTVLAELGRLGHPLLADDLFVLNGKSVRAGPACVDLRPDAAKRIPEARFIGEIGTRARYRLSTPLGPARSALAGFFLLDWSRDGVVSIDRIPAAEGMHVLYKHEYLAILGPTDPNKILDLLEVPVWRVRRPRNWNLMGNVISRILETTQNDD